MAKKIVCCLCGQKISGYGNNPYPLCDENDFESRCCDACDYQWVIPTRMYQLSHNLTKTELNNIIQYAKNH